VAPVKALELAALHNLTASTLTTLIFSSRG